MKNCFDTLQEAKKKPITVAKIEEAMFEKYSKWLVECVCAQQRLRILCKKKTSLYQTQFV